MPIFQSGATLNPKLYETVLILEWSYNYILKLHMHVCTEMPDTLPLDGSFVLWLDYSPGLRSF